MPVLVSCEMAAGRGLIRKLMELRTPCHTVASRPLEGLVASLEEYRLTLYEDMSARAKERAKQRFYDALHERGVPLLLAARDMPLREELMEQGFAFADGASVRLAGAGKAILRVAAAAGLNSSSLRLCVFDPDCAHAARLLPELVGLARCVTVITGNPGPVEELRESIMEVYGAGYMVTDEPSALKTSHVVLGVSGLSRLVRSRAVSRHSLVISLDPLYIPPEATRMLVTDGFVFTLPEHLSKETIPGVPQQEFLEALMREESAFELASLQLEAFTNGSHIIPIRQIAKRVICLDMPA